MSRMRFLNIEVDNLTMDEAVKRIESLIKKNNASYIVTPNMDHIVLAEKDEEFRDIYRNADLVLTDGKPLIWISKLKRKPIVEKVSGADLFPKICRMAAQKGYSIYILGAAKGVAERAADNLRKKYRHLNIVKTYSPNFGFEKNPEEIKYILSDIKKARPDILAVSLGTPKGEKFICRYRKELNVPVSMSIGATIDFEAGNVKRAPGWMSECGLEWLYRIIQEPRRLAKRYWHDAIGIMPIILKYK